MHSFMDLTLKLLQKSVKSEFWGYQRAEFDHVKMSMLFILRYIHVFNAKIVQITHFLTIFPLD